MAVLRQLIQFGWRVGHGEPQLVTHEVEVGFQRVVPEGLGFGEQYLDGEQAYACVHCRFLL
jgi:hypothetical protein